MVLVSKSVALLTTPRYFKAAASRSLATAPRAVRLVSGKRVPIYRVGQLVRLVAKLPPGVAFDMSIRIGKRYYALGSGLSDADGRLSLPVFGTTTARTYPFAFVDPRLGATYYVKVNVGAAR